MYKIYNTFETAVKVVGKYHTFLHKSHRKVIMVMLNQYNVHTVENTFKIDTKKSSVKIGFN